LYTFFLHVALPILQLFSTLYEGGLMGLQKQVVKDCRFLLSNQKWS